MSSPDPGARPTALLMVDGRGRMLARSGPSSLLAMFDHPHAPGVPPIALPFPPEDRPRVLEEVERSAAGGAGARPSIVTAPVPGLGARARLTLTLHPLQEDLVAVVLTPDSVAPVAEDRAGSALTHAWAQLSDAFAFCTPDDNADGPRVVATNPAFDRLFGRTTEELSEVPIARLLAPEEHAGILERIRRHFGENPTTLLDVAGLRHPSGDDLLVEWELAPVADADGRIASFICVVRDASGAARWIPGRRGRDLDPLTGLPNQIHFMGRLERSVERASQARTYAFAVASLQMDGLTEVQHEFGTVVCNTVVDALVWRVRQSLRPGDVIARVGYDRLGILFEHFEPWGSMEAVLERIRGATRAPFTVGGKRIHLSVTGAASPIWSQDHPASSAQHIMDEVDRAMMRIRNPDEESAVEPSRSSRRPVPWFDLADAIRSGRLSLVYLPILSTATQDVVAMEALVRCSVPDGGVLSGREFVRDAERTGLAVRLGRWVARRACRQIADWRQTLGSGEVPPIHVNLSAPEFWHPALVESLASSAAEVSVPPSRLKLEVTETTILRNVTAASAIMAELHDAGFETWLDRLGEGGLPLRELPRLPLHHVKVAPLPAWGGLSDDDPELPHMLGALLRMADDLGWHVSATGIETEAQWRMIREAGFGSGQGFALCEPVDAGDTVALLRQSV